MFTTNNTLSRSFLTKKHLDNTLVVSYMSIIFDNKIRDNHGRLINEASWV